MQSLRKTEKDNPSEAPEFGDKLPDPSRKA